MRKIFRDPRGLPGVKILRAASARREERETAIGDSQRFGRI